MLAKLGFPLGSVTLPAGKETIIVPSELAITLTVQVILSVVVTELTDPEPVPERIISELAKDDDPIAWSKVIVKFMELFGVGSACPGWLMVAVGLEASKIQVDEDRGVRSFDAQLATVCRLEEKVGENRPVFAQLYR